MASKVKLEVDCSDSEETWRRKRPKLETGDGEQSTLDTWLPGKAGDWRPELVTHVKQEPCDLVPEVEIDIAEEPCDLEPKIEIDKAMEPKTEIDLTMEPKVEMDVIRKPDKEDKHTLCKCSH